MRTAAVLLLVFCAAAWSQPYEARIEAALKTVDITAARGPFQPRWPSLETYRVPQWYEDAKFGIFIHWGVYAVPAFGNEWYPRNMYVENDPVFKHHVATYGPQLKFGYKDFIPLFKAEKYDPHAWAALFRNAGAKFVVPVAEHHDGFPLYDCSFTDWSAAKMGPRRDLIGDLAAAVRKQGLRFGASSHRAEHWWFFDGGMKFASDVKDPRYAGLYGPARPRRLPGAQADNPPDRAFLNDWLARTAEIVDKYTPDLLWFDWWIEQPVFEPYLQRFAAFYYNRGATWRRGGVAINYKNKAFPEKTAVLDIERGKLDSTRDMVWQTDTSISLKSWGYIDNDEFRSPDSLIDDLVDIVSKNGLLLLNIGPRPDGTIPEQAQKSLLEIGRWLQLNGEAIYGTRPWKVFGEGPTQVLKGGFTDRKQKPFTAGDIRFTRKGSTLYAILLEWPGREITIKSLVPANLAGRRIASVALLGHKGALPWKPGPNGVTIGLPGTPPGDYACALKIGLR
jgi:alpha-L-fucosidase